jgi:hypothetical protein
MQEPHVIRSFLFPADQQASRTVGPRVSSFHDPAARPTTAASRNRRTFTLSRNVNDVLATTCCTSDRFRIVSLVRAKMLLLATGRLRTPHGNILKRFGNQLLIMHICAGDSYADGHAAPLGQHRPLDAQLATIGRVFPGFFPHPVAPWSSPRPNFATASQFPLTRRTLPEHVATAFRILRVEPILESTHGSRCPTRIAPASPSTDNQSAAHTQFPSRYFAKAIVGVRLCNSVCKLGAAV